MIVGASRGFGRELAIQYAHAGWRVHVTTRTGSCPDGLSQSGGNIVVHKLDVRDGTEIARLKFNIGDEALDVLCVAAGTYDKMGGRFGEGPEIPAEDVFATNTYGPINVVEAVMENLMLSPSGRIALISSAEGIRGNGRQLGVYGESKAALNDSVQRLAPYWAYYGIIGVAVHPGWIRTEMGGEQAPNTPEASAEGTRALIERLTPEDCGVFYDFRGIALPW